METEKEVSSFCANGVLWEAARHVDAVAGDRSQTLGRSTAAREEASCLLTAPPEISRAVFPCQPPLLKQEICWLLRQHCLNSPQNFTNFQNLIDVEQKRYSWSNKFGRCCPQNLSPRLAD
jgi:hypothetical protein